MTQTTTQATASGQALARPITIGELELNNRVWMAPLTRCRSAMPDDTQTALHALYYAQRASAGLIVSEATQISQEGQGYAHTPGIFKDAHVEGWRLVTDAVHNAGGRIFCQLWHVGAVSHPIFHDGELPVSSSPFKPEGHAYLADLNPDEPKPDFPEARALELSEIPRLLDDYRHATRCALAAGFDGVELHAANGYLIDQFMRSSVNRRTDRYGGSIQNRTRLLGEVVDALCEVIDPARIGVRLTPIGGAGGSYEDKPEELYPAAATLLAGRGLAYLHAVRPNTHDDGDPDAQDKGNAILSAMREAFAGPFIANGGFTPDEAERWVADGRADAVAFGRLFIANPDLPARVFQGGPYNEPDGSTFYGGSAEGYVDYPTLHRTRPPAR
jgi:N-ethylmaleimide reductase